MKRLGIKVGLVVLGLALVASVGEVALRIYQQAVDELPFMAPEAAPIEYPLGWGGRRTWGDERSTKPKVLVLGDSMTEGRGVAQDALYYTVMGKLLNVEIFAHGGGGYGTLQESMVLEHSLKTLRPDLVVLQVTSNDFINNDWKIESRSHFNNNLRPRPYLEHGQVRYRFPSSRRWVRYGVTHFRLAYFLEAQLARVLAHMAATGLLESVEHRIQRTGIDAPELQPSIAVTEGLIVSMKQRVRLVVFVGDESPPYSELWRLICLRQGIPFLADVPQTVVDEERRLGVSIRPDGAHWNARGHEVVGRLLARWVSQFLTR